MVSDQLSMLEMMAAAPDTAPRCRMCARPARRNSARKQYAAYCSGSHCSNRQRLCQKCGNSFTMNTGEAGSKYCSSQCKIAGYRAAQNRPYQPLICAWCCEESEPRPGTRRNRVWPHICDPCLDPIRHVLARLRNHHVPHERAQRLISDPGCEICGIDLLVIVTDPRTGKPTSLLVVDHDHRCCPGGSFSCGKCVRGLLCGNCNAATGLLRDDPEFAENLASYLRR